ncbi:hypothetical protein HRI_004422600 [Hibiscus trionum]|uniref:Reverse transcriptase domain-containing protein n=1 Tax=Hibiscus trionum TaxID=183268 RepID=A0A9W7J617_HIBTR|nr:hypothetical protein HRI_004422600 [Hibiscus trionum]
MVSVLTWNVRGLGKAEKFRAVSQGIFKSKAKIIFVQETKLVTINTRLSKRLMGKNFNELAFAPSSGASGGLFTMWNSDFLKVDKTILQDRLIAVIGRMGRKQMKIGLINIYAPNAGGERKRFLEKVLDLIQTSNVPFIVGGDFNEVVSNEERVGVSKAQDAPNFLAEFIVKGEFIDLPLSGGKFTWFRGGKNLAASRLDRFLIAPEVLLAFPCLTQSSKPRGLSDHNPIVLQEDRPKYEGRPFKWFSYWAEDEDYKEKVRSTIDGRGDRDIGLILKDVKVLTKKWARESEAKNSVHISVLEEKIEFLENKAAISNADSADWEELRQLKNSVWERYRKEERDWLQKSRLKWFHEGDSNTKFFHLTASIRRSQNHISSIQKGNLKVDDPNQISLAFEDHFKELYNKLNTLPIKSFDVPVRRLSDESARALETPFSEEEIWSAIKSSDGNRAPGPDGFNLNFFKCFWPNVKQGVLDFFEKFYSGSLLDSFFNQSFVALIPKTPNPMYIEDYRPISLVGSLYKILARVLARRLARCISEVVGDTQFAFVAGKQIAYCSLIANEVIDDLKKKNRKAIIFKADFMRAYDTVSWKFLEFAQDKMGFGSLWKKWIMTCISTPVISVLVNGIPSGPFNIKRGLRQGCSLSPLLFNIVGEMLSSLLNKAAVLGILESVKVGNSNLRISHIQFADDLMVFDSAKEESVRNIIRIMRLFSLCSGLQLNLQKTKIYGINVEEDFIKSVASNARCSFDTLPSSYLGLPLGHSKCNKEMWRPIFILSNLPTYYLSMFELPKSITTKLNGMIANFLWGGKGGKCIHWVNWEKVCKPKTYGGLGIRDIRMKNRAMLNKWVWRYGCERSSLWRKIVDAKYGMDSSRLIPSATIGKRTSRIWKDITKPLSNVNDKFTKSIRLITGDGTSIDFWNDYWTDFNSLREAFPRIYAVAIKKDGKVADFGKRGTDGWCWNIELRRRFFDWEVEVWNEFLITINKAVCSPNLEDRIWWTGGSSGMYSVKDFCDTLTSNERQSDCLWPIVWMNIAPIKVEAFLWKAIQNRIPTGSELVKRGVELNGIICCPLCREVPETVNHLFLHCSIAWQTWQKWCSLWQVHFIIPATFNSFVQMWESVSLNRDYKLIWSMALREFVWSLWLCRNAVIFDSKSWKVEEIFESAMLRTGQWCRWKWPESCTSACDFVRCPVAISIKKKKECSAQNSTWIAPAEGFLKFNVDAAIFGIDRFAGIGGILRDHKGAQLLFFSRFIGKSDPTQAELLSVLEACKSFEVSRWCNSHSLILESDCEMAINWIENPQRTPAVFLSLVKEIGETCRMYNWKLNFVYRERNEAAHKLARLGALKTPNFRGS